MRGPNMKKARHGKGKSYSGVGDKAHLKRLRAALVPFAELVRQNAAPMPGDASAASDDTLQQVLEIARQLRPPEDGT